MSFWSGKPVLVTGGAGMIGSHLVEALAREGAYVTAIDDGSRGRWLNLARTTCERMTLQLGDPGYGFIADGLFADKFAVFHLAARVTGINYNRHHQLEMLEENLRINLDVSDLVQRHRPERYIFVSTACVYPHDAPVPTPESWGDVCNPEPTNFGYGVAKWVGEQEAKLIHREAISEVAIARFYNAAGPRDYYDWETSHVIPALIRKCEEGQDPVVIWGTGLQRRAFVDCRDLAQGLMLLADHGCDGQATNIGHDNQITIADLAQLIVDITGSKARLEFDAAMPEGYSARAADSTRMHMLTAWKPTYKVEQTIEDMVVEYRKGRAAGMAKAREKCGIFQSRS